MKVTIKTAEEMLEDPDVLRNGRILQKEGRGIFFLDSFMEEELCGNTFEIKGRTGIDIYPFMIRGFFVPDYAIKEVLKDED